MKYKTHKRNELTSKEDYPRVECGLGVSDIKDWSYYWKDVNCKNCIKKGKI